MCLAAPKKLFCTFEMMESSCCGRVKTCSLNETIESEDYVLGSEFDTTVKQFSIIGNRDVKFLPKQIVERFPSLQELEVERCGITIVRNHYFKNWRKLQTLSLTNNKIRSIENDSFKDLVSVGKLWLLGNIIETLDEKLFVTMVSLRELSLSYNKIKFLSPKVFEIPGGKLELVRLWSNVCIKGNYDSNKLQLLEAEIKAKCTTMN